MKFNWVLEVYVNIKFRKKKKQLRGRLSNFFGSPIKLLRCFRKSSRDNIYRIVSDGRVIAIARVLNEHRLKILARSPEKYNDLLANQNRKFQREWEMSQRAQTYFLAPVPLFKDDGIMVFKFVEGTLAVEIIKKDPNKLKPIVTIILETLNLLYQLDIFHGDLTLAHCIITGEGKCVFFDLETEMPDLGSREKKIAYEYLHLIDTSIKFLPEEYQNIELWIDIFNKYFDAHRVNGVDITAFKKAFKRLDMLDPDFVKLKKVFA
jgi:hypothetical protein